MGAKGSISNYPERKKFLTKEVYDGFVKDTGSKMSFAQWKNCIKSYNLVWREQMLKQPFGYDLPQGLGVIAVDKYEGRSDLINLADSIKYGKPVIYLNLHSFGFRYKIKWYKHRIVNFRYHRIYSFDACREVKRALASIIKSGLDPYENIKQPTIREKMRLKKYIDKKWEL
jgi:hypothetical protein